MSITACNSQPTKSDEAAELVEQQKKIGLISDLARFFGDQTKDGLYRWRQDGLVVTVNDNSRITSAFYHGKLVVSTLATPPIFVDGPWKEIVNTMLEPVRQKQRELQLEKAKELMWSEHPAEYDQAVANGRLGRLIAIIITAGEPCGVGNDVRYRLRREGLYAYYNRTKGFIVAMYHGKLVVSSTRRNPCWRDGHWWSIIDNIHAEILEAAAAIELRKVEEYRDMVHECRTCPKIGPMVETT